MKLFINNDVLLNTKLSDEAIAVFVALKAIYRSDCDKYYVAVNHVVSVLTGHLSMSRKYSERLSDGLSELTDNGIVPVVEQKGKEYILDLSPFEINHEGKDGKKQHFTVLELDEVQHILNITGTKKDKFSLLRYFAAMMSTINASATIKSDMGVHSKSNFVGFVSQNYIGELCNVTSASTIISYNKLLEQEKLIYIYRNPELIRDPETGKYRNFTNHYGRYRDRWEIEEYAINRNGYEGLMTVPKRDADDGRSLAMKYRYLCNGKDYPQDEVVNIYKYISYTNWQKIKEIESSSNEAIKNDLRKQLRDMSVFDKFPFLDQMRQWDFSTHPDLADNIDKSGMRRKKNVINRNVPYVDSVSCNQVVYAENSEDTYEDNTYDCLTDNDSNVDTDLKNNEENSNGDCDDDDCPKIVDYIYNEDGVQVAIVYDDGDVSW